MALNPEPSVAHPDGSPYDRDAPNRDEPNQDFTEVDDRPDPLLERAAVELRNEDDPSWLTVSTAILTKLRATARRTRVIDAVFPPDSALDGDESDGDTLRVSDQLVLLEISRALREVRCDVRNVELDVVDRHRCAGVHVDIAVFFDDDFSALAALVAERTGAAVETVLGPILGLDDITVHIADLLAADEEAGLQSD